MRETERSAITGGSLLTERQLADLRAARKVLAFDAASTAGGRRWIYPRFQFDGSGQPFPEIAHLLEAFGDVDPIAVCVWLVEPNPLLDGRPPMHFWMTDRARVVWAARRITSVGVEASDLEELAVHDSYRKVRVRMADPLPAVNVDIDDFQTLSLGDQRAILGRDAKRYAATGVSGRKRRLCGREAHSSSETPASP